MAYNVAIHDEDSNKLKQTTVKDMITIANKFKETSGSKAYTEASTLLTQFYGGGKVMFIYWAILFAQTFHFHPEWEKEITLKKLPISYFAEIDYFIGCGSKENKRLSLRTGLAAIEWVYDARSDRKKYAFSNGDLHR